MIVTDNSAFGEIFVEAPLMAILRGMGAERSLAVAHTRPPPASIVGLPAGEDADLLGGLAQAGPERPDQRDRHQAKLDRTDPRHRGTSSASANA